MNGLSVFKDSITYDDFSKYELYTISRIYIYYDSIHNVVRAKLFKDNNFFIDCLWTFLNRDIIQDYISNDTFFVDSRLK